MLLGLFYSGKSERIPSTLLGLMVQLPVNSTVVIHWDAHNMSSKLKEHYSLLWFGIDICSHLFSCMILNLDLLSLFFTVEAVTPVPSCMCWTRHLLLCIQCKRRVITWCHSNNLQKKLVYWMCWSVTLTPLRMLAMLYCSLQLLAWHWWYLR